MRRFFQKIIYCLLISKLSICWGYALPEMSGSSNLAYLPPAEEMRLAKKYLHNLVLSGQLYHDPIARDYVQGIGNRLVASMESSGHHFQFLLANNPQVNAFAGPGGIVVVNTGLILGCSNEDELAAVLAHELGHVTQGHLSRQLSHLKQMRLPTAVGILTALAIGSQVPQAGTAALAATMSSVETKMLQYSREHEQEADQVGINTLYQAGYDPQAMIAFLENIQRQENHGADFSVLLSSHPLTSQRISDLADRVNQLPPRLVNRHPQFNFIKARLTVTTNKDPFSLVNYFKKSSKQHQQRADFVYGLGLAYISTEQYQQAHEILADLQSRYPDNGLFQLAYADSAAALGNWSEAREVLKPAYLQHEMNYPLLLAYSRSLIETGDPEQAIDLLQRYILDHPDKQKPFGTLSQAQAKAGFTKQAYETRAKYFLQRGLVPQAIQQLQMALALPGLDERSQHLLQEQLDVLRG